MKSESRTQRESPEELLPSQKTPEKNVKRIPENEREKKSTKMNVQKKNEVRMKDSSRPPERGRRVSAVQ